MLVVRSEKPFGVRTVTGTRVLGDSAVKGYACPGNV